MIKTVIKRDGESEPFSPSKLNKWGAWASETLGSRVDWSSIVLETVRRSPPEISSSALQAKLVEVCNEQETWAYSVMAGRLYSANLRKNMFGDRPLPTLRKLHKRLVKLGLLRQLNYTDDEYDLIDRLIDHDRDFSYAQFQIEYIINKYSVQSRTNKVTYETPQFVYIRMAMALSEDEPQETRLTHLKNYYDHLSLNRVNAPTPNYVNLGTPHYGLASCCLYTAGDSAESLAIGDHIAYTMTYMSAGIGSNIDCRSLGDEVKKGMIKHQGKLPYYKSLASAVKANMQGGRGGAATQFFSCYDPEAMSIIMLQNPRTPTDKQNRDLHFAMLTNRFFATKFARNEDIFTFNVYTAPDLHDLFYSGDRDAFERLYLQYEANPKFKKHYISARKLMLAAGQQWYDVATMYHLVIDEANTHTSFKEPIRQSNLCMEITNPTSPYQSMPDLYSQASSLHSGEVGICTIAGIVVPNIRSEEEYASAAYYALKMIDKCIDLATYALPHVEYTAKMRRNAAVGIVGLAETMAKANVKYSSPEGLQKLHEVGERHAYHCISQSLRLGQELGNCGWMHKTKWPDGWLPIDTYKRTVDELASPTYKYDWEALRQQIVQNKGIRHSSLIAHMPSESSSKASGCSNGLYPIRSLALGKSDAGSNIRWVAKDSDIIGSQYEIAWDIDEISMIKAYSVIQKWTDQSISADLYRNRSVNINISTEEIGKVYLAQIKYGLKSKYYTNSLTSAQAQNNQPQEVGCASGVCTL